MRISVDWKPWMFALLATLLGLAGTFTVERVERGRMLDHERRHVFTQLGELRARLEGTLTGNLLMIRGLSAVIAARPGLDQEEFARIAAGMVGPEHALRNIGGAPDLVIRLLYPLAGNEAAIGLDYRTHPTQGPAALRAVESGETVVAGPLELVQGGQALVAREPVFLAPAQAGGTRTLWGLVSAVIDVERLYGLAGLHEVERSQALSLAIRGRDGTGADGEVFYGDQALFADAPETVSVSLPSGSWLLAARPAAGWQSHVHNDEIVAIRLLGLFITALIAVLAYAVARNTIALRRTAVDLEESQRLFEGFMDNLPAGTFVKDVGSGRMLFENRWLREHLPDAGRGCGADGDEDLETLRAGPSLAHREFEASGGQRMYCDTLRFLLPDGGVREFVGGVVMDVSERVRAQQRLTDSRARLRALLDTIPDLVWMKDPNGVYLACNRRFEAFFGASEAEIAGRRDHDFVPKELADFFRERDLASIAAGEPTVNEERVRFASDGHSELLETIKAPVLDETGELVGVLGIARDITARRAAEDALRASAERLRTAESIAHIGNWEYRVSDGAITWSDETYRILGLEPGERAPSYEWLMSQIHPDDRSAHDDFLQHMLAARPGDPFPEQRFRLQRDDGQALVISVHVQIDFGADSRPTRLFGTVQDITEHEALTHNLQERLNELTRWQAVILGREDRIQELKQEVNELLTAQGRPTRYDSVRESS